MHRIASAAAIAALIASTTACSSGSASNGSVAEQPRSVAATTGAVVEKEPLNAQAIIDQLRAAGLGLTGIAVQTENDDPNNLLGRPDGYTSRASADLPGGDEAGDEYSVERGLVVEVFGRADLAQRRSDYIKGLQSASPILGTEWHYRTSDGSGLVRVSGNVKPSLAKKVEAAVAALTAGGITASPAPSASADDSATALRTAVQAYSDAYLTGKSSTAYALLSARCRKRMSNSAFSALTSAAETMYGSALPIRSFDADVSGDLARVTYTYDLKAINQDAEPWVREDGKWKEDDC
jgi:hypothetical protein